MRVEPQAVGWVPWPVHPEAVELTGGDVRDRTVPDAQRVLGELVARLGAVVVPQVDVDDEDVGHARGGPAKVAVISSGLMGTISGSGIANVLTVGQFTIPLMKRYGYSSVFAGAVEAAAHNSGVARRRPSS